MADLKDRGGSQRRSRLATLWLFACVAAGLLLAAPAAVQIFGLAGSGQAEASDRRTVNVGDVRVDGRAVNIEDVKSGDTVWAYDTAAGEWRPARVVRPQTHLYEGDVITVSAAGQAIEATGNHPFWVAEGAGLSARPPAEDVGAHERDMQSDGRWVEARHLQPGDLLLLRNGELATVEELATRRQRLKVYNIEVADLHTYAVSGAGVLVHNKAMSASGPTPPSYMIDDGVRRAKAASLRNQKEIPASIDEGPEVKLPIDQLQSPKPNIALETEKDMERWRSINEAMDIDPDLLPPINVRPGSGGTPIPDVTVGG